jgi:hypothetical protein
MATLLASALVDDAHGCALLAQAIKAEGAVGRPALTDPEAVIDTLARLRQPAKDTRDLYDCLVQAFVVDLDVLGEVVNHAVPMRPATDAPALSAPSIRSAARAASRRLRPWLRPVAA